MLQPHNIDFKRFNVERHGSSWRLCQAVPGTFGTHPQKKVLGVHWEDDLWMIIPRI